MQLNNVTSLQDVLEQLTTEQLDEILQEELHKEQIDDHAVRLIMRMLREREEDLPAEITPEIEQAWVRYQDDIAIIEKGGSRRQRIRGWVVRAASVAAVFCLIILIFPQQAGAETFWERLSRWTESIVEFFGLKDDGARIVEYEFKTDNTGLQLLYNAVVEMGVTDPVVPMWLPEGYELVESKAATSPRRMGTYARFSDGTSETVLEVNVHLDDFAHSYYKNEETYDTYERNGTTFYIIRNETMWVAIWTKDNIECSIYIDCQEDTLDEILRSIYKWRAA